MPTSNLTLNQWTQIYIGGSSLVDQYVQVSAGKALISLGTPSDATTVIDSSSFDDKVIYVPAATSVYARPNGVPFTTVSWGNYGSGQSVAGYELAASYLAGMGVASSALNFHSEGINGANIRPAIMAALDQLRLNTRATRTLVIPYRPGGWLVDQQVLFNLSNFNLVLEGDIRLSGTSR